MASFFNITTELTQELIAVGANVTVSKISLTNIHDDTPCTVDLYIEKKITGKFYLLKNTLLPVGATLIYDETNFNTRGGGFSLFIKLNKSASEIPAVDVIIN
jgi:hypothetical protein|tara:strand:+ start:401 stop:706 length:306 start_codon:yes stop_codon:yes gene_type:complete